MTDNGGVPELDAYLATATQNGTVSIGTQTFGGDKTFQDAVTVCLASGGFQVGYSGNYANMTHYGEALLANQAGLGTGGPVLLVGGSSNYINVREPRSGGLGRGCMIGINCDPDPSNNDTVGGLKVGGTAHATNFVIADASVSAVTGGFICQGSSGVSGTIGLGQTATVLGGIITAISGSVVTPVADGTYP